KADRHQHLDQRHPGVGGWRLAHETGWTEGAHRRSSAEHETAPIASDSTDVPSRPSAAAASARTGWVATVTTAGSLAFAVPVMLVRSTRPAVSEDQDAT